MAQHSIEATTSSVISRKRVPLGFHRANPCREHGNLNRNPRNPNLHNLKIVCADSLSLRKLRSLILTLINCVSFLASEICTHQNHEAMPLKNVYPPRWAHISLWDLMGHINMKLSLEAEIRTWGWRHYLTSEPCFACPDFDLPSKSEEFLRSLGQHNDRGDHHGTTATQGYTGDKAPTGTSSQPELGLEGTYLEEVLEGTEEGTEKVPLGLKKVWKLYQVMPSRSTLRSSLASSNMKGLREVTWVLKNWNCNLSRLKLQNRILWANAVPLETWDNKEHLKV